MHILKIVPVCERLARLDGSRDGPEVTIGGARTGARRGTGDCGLGTGHCHSWHVASWQPPGLAAAH